MAEMRNEIVVGLHVGPNTGPERAFRKWPDTIDLLHESGVDVALINDNSEIDEVGHFAQARMLGTDETAVKAADNVRPDSMRDYTGRFQGHQAIRTINEREVLDLVRDKGAMHAVFGDDVMGRTARLDDLSIHELSDLMHDLPGEDVVLKPAQGLSSKGLVVASKGEAVAHIARLCGQNYVIQEYLPSILGVEVVQSLKGLDDQEQAKLRHDAAHELRLFMTGETEEEIVPVLRQEENTPVLTSNDIYVYLDPESVPAAAYDLGKFVMRTIKQQTGVNEVLSAIDLLHDPSAGTWHLREANGKEPTTPTSSEQPQVAARIHGNYVRQLVRLAKMPPKANNVSSKRVAI